MKAKYRVLLVNAPLCPGGSTSGNYAAFPALGVIAIGTQVRKHFGTDVEVAVRDGGLHSADEIRRCIDCNRPHMVGISVLTPTYTEGLSIAAYAKNRGAITVLGGDHACCFSKLILQRRPCIDYVVQADGGEVPFLYIVSLELGCAGGWKVQSGPEKVFGRKGGVVCEIASFPRLKLSEVYSDLSDVPDISLIEADLDAISSNYNKLYKRFHRQARRPMTVNNLRGCRNGVRRCIYCSVWDLRINVGSVRFFWDTVRTYHRNHGVDFIFEVADSFFSNPGYVRELMTSRPFEPKKRGLEFEVYARADDIVNDPESCRLLGELNVTRVNLGLDSADDEMLGNLRKNSRDMTGGGLSPSMLNYEAVRRLAAADISCHVSFPLGALGETRESLARTVGFVKLLAADFPDHLATVEASALVPLPNSPAWDLMVGGLNGVVTDFGHEQEGLSPLERARACISERAAKQIRERFEGEDVLDVQELAGTWIQHFTHVEAVHIEEAQDEILDTAKRIGAASGRAI